ncbi:hypothetical protein [Micromonospora sp. WMMD1155]|uniref:hypothetical protein n=1 Tax=Micromonospora sp. WMMD1155 TaxID=3016094 RepID=UPI00249BEB43|nr:hypothetical protein [Micromonospora sp. WMMD1155]WFE52506.1 hypothetical protein O7617_20260 [Micromonospora sp. WMMD1155]
MRVDGDAGRTLTMPPTTNWDTWSLASGKTYRGGTTQTITTTLDTMPVFKKH